MIQKMVVVIVAGVIVACGSMTASAAQEAADSANPWKVQQRAEHILKTDAAAQTGGLGVWISSLSVKRELKLENGLPIDLGFSVTHYHVSDSTPVDLPASLESKGITVGTKFPVPFVTDDRFFIGLDTGAFYQTASDHACPSAAFRSKNRAYLIFRRGPETIWVAGVRYTTDYEDRSTMPFIGVRHRFNENWSIDFLSDRPQVRYQADARTVIFAEIVPTQDEFEVVDGSRRGNIVQVRDLRAGLGVRRSINADVEISLMAGWAFSRQYEYLQGGGKVVPEDGIYAGYALSAKF